MGESHVAIARNRHVEIAALALLATLAAAPAKARVVLETATLTGIDNGEYIVGGGRTTGVEFTLTQETEITGVGGQFGGYPGGTIFAAIVPVDPATSLPTFAPSDLASEKLAYTTWRHLSGLRRFD